ncbi:hypothetical protein [Brevundimonas sp. SL161]|uniref:hypothetical protein n=1 Tax=Brevundimonas sp. SL161 TaxID=2804613 RepID=UPI003CF2DA04
MRANVLLYSEFNHLGCHLDGVRFRRRSTVSQPGWLAQRILRSLLDDVVIVGEAELRETLVRLALEEQVIVEGTGALAAGRRVAGKRKCAVVSGGNIDAAVLAKLLADVHLRATRRPRRSDHDQRWSSRRQSGNSSERTETLTPEYPWP